MATNKEIQALALRIAEAAIPDLLTFEEACAINTGGGWSFDIREGEYVNAQDWTRVQGLVLADDELRRALTLAERYVLGQ